MRRSLYVAALSLSLLAMPVWAQRHGSGGGHPVSHGSSSSHSFGSSGSAHANFHGVNSGRGSGINLRIGDPFRHNRRYYGHRGYYPYAAYYPYGYYGWGIDPFYDTSDRDSYAAEYQSAPYRDDSGVQRDLDQLNGKIDRLQEDVEARNRPPQDAEPETALVFRDQHVEEIRNYAIAGGTLWVLNDHQAGKKIPLAQLDLDATVKKNDERGVDFQVPR